MGRETVDNSLGTRRALRQYGRLLDLAERAEAAAKKDPLKYLRRERMRWVVLDRAVEDALMHLAGAGETKLEPGPPRPPPRLEEVLVDRIERARHALREGLRASRKEASGE